MKWTDPIDGISAFSKALKEISEEALVYWDRDGGSLSPDKGLSLVIFDKTTQSFYPIIAELHEYDLKSEDATRRCVAAYREVPNPEWIIRNEDETFMDFTRRCVHTHTKA